MECVFSRAATPQKSTFRSKHKGRHVSELWSKLGYVKNTDVLKATKREAMEDEFDYPEGWDSLDKAL